METANHNEVLMKSFLSWNPHYCPRGILDYKVQIPMLGVGITMQVKSVGLRPDGLWPSSDLTTDYDVTHHMTTLLQASVSSTVCAGILNSIELSWTPCK